MVKTNLDEPFVKKPKKGKITPGIRLKISPTVEHVEPLQSSS